MVDIDSFWFKLIKSIFACVVSAYLVTAFTASVPNFVRIFLPDFLQWAGFSFYPVVLIGTYALSVLLFLGLPVQALLQVMKKTGWITALIAGLVVASILSGFVFFLSDEFLPLNGKWGIFAFGCGLGMFYASVFWLIRRPDKDDTQPRRAPPTFKVSALSE